MQRESFLERCKQRTERTLEIKLSAPAGKTSERLQEAMNYSVLNGGKRIRAALVYAIGEPLGAKPFILDEIGAAIEMIHAFSLIHDDLPALDNDNLRRGKAACHTKFGESTAILAGDALQSLAFETLASLHEKHKQLKIENELRIIQVLAHAIGFQGMAGGEQLDLMFMNNNKNFEEIEEMYVLKTGKLIASALMCGALAANCNNEDMLNILSESGNLLGLAFQIHDDIIGIETTTEILGKTQGNDLALGKSTYPALMGLEKAKEIEKKYYTKALDLLNQVSFDKSKLENIAKYIIERQR